MPAKSWREYNGIVYKRYYTSPIERRTRAVYVQLTIAVLTALAVGWGIWACARWAGAGRLSAAWLALGTLNLVVLCNLRWPVFAKLRDIQLYRLADPPAADLVERKLRSNWFLILCCVGVSLWGLGCAALLAGGNALAHVLWSALVVLNGGAVLVLKGQPPFARSG